VQLAALQAENAKLRPFGIPLPFHGMGAYSPLAVRPVLHERLTFLVHLQARFVLKSTTSRVVHSASWYTFKTPWY